MYFGIKIHFNVSGQFKRDVTPVHIHWSCILSAWYKKNIFFSCQQWEKSWEWWLACTWHIAWVRPMRYMDSVHRHLVCRMMRGGLEVARVASQAWDTGRHPCSTPVTGPHTATWSWAHTATTGDMSNTCNTHWLANWTGTRLGKHLAEYEVTVVLPGHLLWLLLLL